MDWRAEMGFNFGLLLIYICEVYTDVVAEGVMCNSR